MHKKVHGSDKYRCLTISYSILSDFKETFRIPPSFPPSFLPDQYARGVVVYCEGAVSYLACWLVYLGACLLAYLVVWLVSC